MSKVQYFLSSTRLSSCIFGTKRVKWFFSSHGAELKNTDTEDVVSLSGCKRSSGEIHRSKIPQELLTTEMPPWAQKLPEQQTMWCSVWRRVIPCALCGSLSISTRGGMMGSHWAFQQVPGQASWREEGSLVAQMYHVWYHTWVTWSLCLRTHHLIGETLYARQDLPLAGPCVCVVALWLFHG